VTTTFGGARNWAVLAIVLAALVAGAGTVFGFEFAPEAHGHDEAAEAEHAEGEEAGEEAEEGDHAAEEEDHEGAEAGHEAEEAEEDGGGMIVSAILIGLAGGVLAPATGLVVRRREPAAMPDAAPGASAALPIQLAALSTGAAVIHFAVVAQHLEEWWLTGVFFIVIAVFQLLWGLLVVLRPSLPVYLSGAVVNALIVVTWIVSRTTGVPVGPEAGEAESIGFPDVLATAFEVLLVALAVKLALQPSNRLSRTWSALNWPVVVATAALTALALAILA
jgi:hypothetical protein